MSKDSKDWTLSAWTTNPYALRGRWKTRAILHETCDKRSLKSYDESLDWIYKRLPKESVIWALIDSSEEYRLEAFQLFRKGCRPEYDELASKIADVQKDNETSTPEIIIQCLAVSGYMKTLPFSAQRCSCCGETIKEGADIIWRRCKKHIFCMSCYDSHSSRGLKLIHSWCRCINPIALRSR